MIKNNMDGNIEKGRSVQTINNKAKAMVKKLCR